MSPQDVRRTNHVDAALSALGIVALFVLAFVRPDWDSRFVIGAITALAMRSTAVMVNAAKMGRQILFDKIANGDE